MSSGICELCQKVQFKYTCPKCNVCYCSVDCYKSPAHLRCSEEFYKNCIQEELSSSKADSGNDVKKIYEILQRIREADSGIQPGDFDESDLDEPLDLDSDDDQPEEEGENYEAADDDDDDCLANRLEGININDADEVWQRLNASEKEEFKKMVQCGDIMKIVPDYKPWWVKETKLHSKIIELHSNGNEQNDAGKTTSIDDQRNAPCIVSNIPKFTDICKKTPSPCVHYNLWNILTAYACIVRHFAGEHLTSVNEAAAQLVNLSASLKYGTNFEDVEDAIISVEMEALSTHSSTTATSMPIVLVESRELLKKDAYDLMFTQTSKMAALSDILNLFQLAKREISTNGNDKVKEFQKLFSLCSGSIEVDRKKLRQLIKKIEFFISFVQQEAEVNLN